MLIQEFSVLLNLIQLNSYVLIFLLALVEGPIITAAASYAASLGYLNIWAILFISAIGNIIPDVIFYSIGRFSRNLNIDSIKKRFKLDDSQINKLEDNLKKHSGKTLFFVKLCPMLPIPGLLLSGFVRMSFKKFLLIDLVFNITASVIFVLIGYYFGYMINSILSYFKIGQYSILGVIILIFIVYLFYRKINTREKSPTFR